MTTAPHSTASSLLFKASTNDLAEDTARVDRGMALVTPTERREIMGYAREDDRLRALLGRLLIRRAVSELVQCDHRLLELRRTGLGKPVLVHPVAPVTFSISHHNHWVIIVASTAFAVGCDIVSQHQSKEAYARIAAVCLSPDESMMYITGDDTYPVSIIWALKESYLKAIGVGLQMDMQRLQFVMENHQVPVVRSHFLETLSQLQFFVDNVLITDWDFRICRIDDTHLATAVFSPPLTRAAGMPNADTLSFTMLSSDALLTYLASGSVP
ncbi:holo-[acyl-carrier-protein] synthase [Plasmodiophora brassicae]